MTKIQEKKKTASSARCINHHSLLSRYNSSSHSAHQNIWKASPKNLII
ncbi:hypothetical protein OIU79_022540 [Salix purpurea]|uniref:Uncharacterized protein n=1 Tax=Salix purpurea TaxID=77065 RepID=A0A9Q0WHP7_SALPP|nr:hypothetical protein OIU79_022540 [Salix purpurea]